MANGDHLVSFQIEDLSRRAFHIPVCEIDADNSSNPDAVLDSSWCRQANIHLQRSRRSAGTPAWLLNAARRLAITVRPNDPAVLHYVCATPGAVLRREHNRYVPAAVAPNVDLLAVRRVDRPLGYGITATF